MRFIAATVCLALAAAAFGVERVETIDAKTIEGAVESINAQQVQVKLPAGPQTLPLADVGLVELGTAESLLAQAGATIVVTRAGDTLGAANVKLADGKVTFDNKLGKVSCDVAAISAIYFTPAGLSPQAIIQQAKDVASPSESVDTIVIDQGKEWTGVEGVLVAVGDQKVTLRYEGEDRLIDRRNIRAIRLAAPAAAIAKSGTLTLVDGSEVAFSAVTLEGDTFRVKSPALGDLSIARKIVGAVRLISPRVTELSQLKPVIEEAAYFDVKTPVGINKSAAGGPLKLGGRTFASGVGASSLTKLEYAIDGQYKTFVAIVGIDDAARPLGNASVSFVGDDKELTPEITVTGKDAPAEVRLNLTGVKKLTIRIGFGPDNLPVGDQVDIASARLIK